MSVDDLLREYLDDDRPTTPGLMRWVPCDCTRAARFRPADAPACEVCSGLGQRLTLVERVVRVRPVGARRG
jgi:hypothetical protein